MPGDNHQSVKLNCANLRIAFLAFDLLFLMFTLFFLGLVARYSDNPTLAEPAKQLSHFFSDPKAFMTGPVIVLGTIMYFAFARKSITWYNGLRVDDNPVDVDSYQIKEFSARYTFIYFKSAGKLWIVYPVTSQDNRKLPDVERMNKELAHNQAQVALLKEKLSESGAVQKRFWFFTKDVVIFFSLFALIIATTMLAGLLK
ncbi:hypothetical protein D0C36_04520 [Mucilaginibacter conchicola]|uniref:Uncharacterized protein n=2 Tax=Mucilaginibacter conchicola TaxID=2303333 RepID=A0A372NXG4_9SPHI|nr:hypothetical protein D0C36_04520 [Mucilaginibacter conchicola]